MTRVPGLLLRAVPIFAAVLVAVPAPAQGATVPRVPPRMTQHATVDPALEPTVRSLRAALADLARADRELTPSEGASTLRAADDAVLERRGVARARIAAGLDSLLDAGAAGRVAIHSLATDWPGADQVRRAEVRAAFRAGDATDALVSVNRLAATAPRDTQLVRWRAEALESLQRPTEALRARQARFELAPDDPTAWRALLAAHLTAGSLPALRMSLSRLRLLYPESRSVWEHEIEVLHRLGRSDEAAKVSMDSTWRRP